MAIESVEDIDIYSAETQQDWYPTYDFLREEAPVYNVPGTNMYVITRYDDVLHVLRYTDKFPTGVGGARGLCKEAHDYWTANGWPKKSVLSVNPPDHKPRRDLIDHFFDADGAAQHTDMINGIIHGLIDTWIDKGEIEYVRDFAEPLPIEVITRLLGLGVQDIPQLKKWSAAWVLPFSGNLTEEQEMFVAHEGVDFQNYIHEIAQERRANPQNDVLSHLVQVELDGRPLTDAEVINITDHLFIGGNETTTFAMTSGIYLLLNNPQTLERITADRSLVPQAVEEILRLESPTMGLFRVNAFDTEIAGVEIPAGATLHIRYAAANRDERMFSCPHAMDLDRKNSRRHMAFSLGEHHCPGSGLSRLEQNLALNAVLDRVTDLAFAEGKNDFSHAPGLVLNAMNELHITFRRSPSTQPD